MARRLNTIAEEINETRPELRAEIERGFCNTDRDIRGDSMKELDLNDGNQAFWLWCQVCSGPRLCSSEQSVFVQRGEGKDATLHGLDICDDCRRKLCTCGTCSSYQYQDEGLCCSSVVPKTKHWHDWCRDGYRQAKPIMVKEAEKELNKCD